MLRYRFDLPLADTAAILNIPVGAAKSRLHHAQRFLRAVLDAGEREAIAS